MGRISGVGAFLVVAGLAATVSAQPRRPAPTPAPTPAPEEPSSDDAAARLLFTTAREAFAAGNYEVALARFQQAYELSHRSALLYNIGTTLDRMRRDREALAAFERFLAEDATSPNRAEVEARVRVLREAVAAEDAQIAEQERLAAEQARALEAARNQGGGQSGAATEESSGLTPIVFISVGGAAVATGVVGLAFGIRTNNLNDTYRRLGTEAMAPGAPDPSDEEVQSAYDDAKSSQRVANAMLFSSAAFTVGAVVLIFVTDWDGSGSDTPSDASRVRVLPSMAVAPGEGHVGLQVRF